MKSTSKNCMKIWYDNFNQHCVSLYIDNKHHYYLYNMKKYNSLREAISNCKSYIKKENWKFIRRFIDKDVEDKSFNERIVIEFEIPSSESKNL